MTDSIFDPFRLVELQEADLLTIDINNVRNIKGGDDDEDGAIQDGSKRRRA